MTGLDSVPPTPAQLARMNALGEHVTCVELNPFDLPPGWVYVVVDGIHYGIDPDGNAHS